MPYAVFYDTETTGLARGDIPLLHHPAQPHLVQVAALMVDLDTRLVVSTLDVLVRPDGWTIPRQATAIHGITQERALACGVDEGMAAQLLAEMCMRKMRVGHNQDFDSDMVSIALARYEGLYTWTDWSYNMRFCTMQAAKPVMKLPASPRMIAAGHGDEYKPPRLSEAYAYFAGLPMQGAHNAKMDARATMEVFFALRDMGLTP